MYLSLRSVIATLIAGALESWPAMGKWEDLNWWCLAHGHRTVPLELGAYNSSDWKEAIATLGGFVRQYMAPSVKHDSCQMHEAREADAAGSSASKPQVAYLAQHRLFDQIPELLDDVQEPSLWSRGFEVVNMWMGTSGTVRIPRSITPHVSAPL
jgi:hypothetical protein